MKELLEEEEKDKQLLPPDHREEIEKGRQEDKSQTLFMSKFGNLSVGGEGTETDTGTESGNGFGEGDDVFKSMTAECLHARKKGETA